MYMSVCHGSPIRDALLWQRRARTRTRRRGMLGCCQTTGMVSRRRRLFWPLVPPARSCSSSGGQYRAASYRPHLSSCLLWWHRSCSTRRILSCRPRLRHWYSRTPPHARIDSDWITGAPPNHELMRRCCSLLVHAVHVHHGHKTQDARRKTRGAVVYISRNP